MKAQFQITSDETGTVLLKRRKIAKALRWWLRENGMIYKHNFFCSFSLKKNASNFFGEVRLKLHLLLSRY